MRKIPTRVVSADGQLTIPWPIRRALGLRGGEQFLVTDRAGDLVFTLLPTTKRRKEATGP